jgi:tetratricopeptide (TPR) repeat protein
MGETEKSVEAGRKAVTLGPDSHYAQCDLAWAYYFDRQYEVAAQEVSKTIQEHGNDCPHHMGLEILIDVAQKSDMGQSLVTTIDRIEREVDTTNTLPIYNLSLLAYAHALEGNSDEAYRILEQMELQGISGTAKVYAALGENDRAFEILESAISNRSFLQMFVIKKAPWLDPLRDDPRFAEILQRMGLNDEQLRNY